MKTIGIADFKKLVMERLENPSLFENKTLLLWHARYTQDSLAYQIIEDCCIQYNQLHPDNQVWFKYSDFLFAKDDNTKIEAFCDLKEMYGFKNHGILFNTGCYMKSQSEDWLSFINTHNNSVGHLSSQWVMIACVNDPTWNEDSFGDNCILYLLQPSIDEWYDWFKTQYDAAVIDPVLAFMKKKGLSTVDFFWERLLGSLNRKMRHKGVNSLIQLSQGDFESAVRGSLPDFPVEDLWAIIHNPD